jgi:hypothetical protein
MDFFCWYNNTTYVKLLSIIIWPFFIISPYIIYGYLWLFSKNLVIFCYCKLFQFRLFIAIINYFWLLKVISLYVITSNYRLL